jgi:hypothetical protein
MLLKNQFFLLPSVTHRTPASQSESSASMADKLAWLIPIRCVLVAVYVE